MKLTDLHRQATHISLIEGDDVTIAAAKAATAATLKSIGDAGTARPAAAAKATPAKKTAAKKAAAKKTARP